MDKTLESTLETSINTLLFTCDDEGVFTMIQNYPILFTCDDEGVFTMIQNYPAVSSHEIGVRDLT
jgi:hypothetical protein